jgi:hypothetical protein
MDALGKMFKKLPDLEVLCLDLLYENKIFNSDNEITS